MKHISSKIGVAVICTLVVATVLSLTATVKFARSAAQCRRDLAARAEPQSPVRPAHASDLADLKKQLADLQGRYDDDIESYQERIEEMRSALEQQTATRRVSPGPGAMPDETAMTTTPAPPVAAPPHAAGGGEQWLAQFDRQMDRAFEHLEQREQQVADDGSREILEGMKAKLVELDGAWSKYDFAETEEDKRAAQREIQGAMGSIIALNRRDRTHTLSELARQAGYRSEEDIQQFVRAVEQAYRDTNLDWAQLFNRGPVVPPSGPTEGGLPTVSPGLVSPTN
ncbi:MAG: hypothetical protein KJ626_06535 [Verrucomicrobia bacterium]|nr:hypothetical protein [Verrucomicrobiota bacterium]